MGFVARRRDRPSGAFRPEWYDRNPVIKPMLTYLTNQAPHSYVERWSYTVPAGKMAFVEMLVAKIVRMTAATTAARPSAEVVLTDGGYNLMPLLSVWLFTNAVGDKDEMSLGQSVILLAGNNLKGTTVDASVGGSLDYMIVAKITEFDA